MIQATQHGRRSNGGRQSCDRFRCVDSRAESSSPATTCCRSDSSGTHRRSTRRPSRVLPAALVAWREHRRDETRRPMPCSASRRCTTSALRPRAVPWLHTSRPALPGPSDSSAHEDFRPGQAENALALPHIAAHLRFRNRLLRMLCPQSHPDATRSVPLLARRLSIRIQQPINVLFHRPQFRLGPVTRFPLGWDRAGQRLAHHPPMHAMLPHQPQNRLARLIFAAQHFEQFHFAPPVHPGILSFWPVQVGQIRCSKWANSDARTHFSIAGAANHTFNAAFGRLSTSTLLRWRSTSAKRSLMFQRQTRSARSSTSGKLATSPVRS